MKNKNTIFATLTALFAQIIFGLSFMFTGIALKNASPMTVIADRYIVAFIGLSVLMVITKRKIRIGKNIWKLILMSIFQPLLYFIFETYGIQMTSSSFSGVMVSMIPVVSMISGIFILNEKPTISQYIFAMLSVAGVVIAVLFGKSEGIVTTPGVILLLGAVFSSVGYNISSRRISTEFSTFERTYAMSFIGMISFLLVSFIENFNNPISIFSPFTNISYTVSILYLGVFSSVIAFLCLNFANTHLPVAKTTVFSNLTTVVSVLAGAFILNEVVSKEIIVAIIMIIIGVFGVQISNRKDNRNLKP